MDLNWTSSWEEETTGFAAEKHATFKPNFDHHHGEPWTAADDGGADWAALNYVQSSFPFDTGKRERRLSETSGWGSSDDRGKDDGGQPSPKLRPLSLPVPARQVPPDPWATASAVGTGREGFRDEDSDLTKGARTQETESLDREANQNGGNIELASASMRGNTRGLALEEEDIWGEFDDHEISPKEQQDISFLRSHADATSSRASSSHSDHGDRSTGSSRTSFEQELANELPQEKDVDDKTVKEAEDGSVSSEIRLNTVTTTENQPGDESDLDDFGDFETEDSGFEAPEVFSVGNEGLESDIARNSQEAVFKVDPTLLEELFADIFPLPGPSSANTPDLQTNEDFLTTIEERKTWHRISRYGTMRKHDTGNDENYRRVKWDNSKIRDATTQIVSRWRTQDTVGVDGSAVFAGGNKGFWDDEAKRNSGPINMSAIWAERAAKHRSMPLPMPSKSNFNSRTAIVNEDQTVIVKQDAIATVKQEPLLSNELSKPSPDFGWNTGNRDENKPPTLPPLLSLKPPLPLSTPSSKQVCSKLSLRPGSMDLSSNPRVESLNGLGHRSTMSLDGKRPPLKSVPTVPAAKPVLPATKPEDRLRSEPDSKTDDNNDDDWGEMVSSTPDLDASFPPLGETFEEPAASRNRADSAPGLPKLEPFSQTQRPVSLQAGTFSPSSLADVAGWDKMLPNLSPAEPLKSQSQFLMPISHSPVTVLPNDTPPSNSTPMMPTPMMPTPMMPTPMMPKLLVITDDIDAWATALPTPLKKEGTSGISTPVGILESEVVSTMPSSAPKTHSITADDFDAWGSFEDLPTPTVTTNLDSSSTAAAIETSTLTAKSNAFTHAVTPTNPYTVSAPKSAANELDGWGDVDFSIFETLTVTPAPAVQSLLPKSNIQLFKSLDGNWGKAHKKPGSRMAGKESTQNAEEERIVRSIIGGLPDLSYMFRR